MQPLIALIAHDRKKDEMVGFVRDHRQELAGCRLATNLATAHLVVLAVASRS